MSKTKLLSICIPTYNREPYLKQLLDSIVSQKAFSETNDVEIVIDDGPSKDNTQQLVKDYQNKYPGKIRYFRNDKAIGMCPAFLEAIEFSGGEYTWLFGSDDLMTSEALSTTLNIIKKEKPGIILSDRYVFSSDLEKEKLNIFMNKKDIVLNGSNDFFSFLGKDNKENGSANGVFFTFISIFCFKQNLYLRNKELFLNKYIQYKGLDNNYFNFAIIPFFDIIKEKIVIIKSKIMVLARGDNHGWSFSSMKIFNDLYFLVKVLRKQYKIPKKCNAFLNHMLIGWYLPSLMGLIKNNRFLGRLYFPLKKIYSLIGEPIHNILRKI
ncbi:glycosyl transferase family protein [candidate division SR1 bacterium RAAC1_SR1_1]|nr:glycosyl transferase family protein [candidate division SR1 bacterium RAAC1_SR1_1]